MATGRALVVHASHAARVHYADLLMKEGFRVETVSSTYRCMARFVDDPADLVVVGLERLAEGELELIPALKSEVRPPRLLVTFPAPRRELAVRALEVGADGYVLEPFYPAEFVGAVRGHLAPRKGAEPPALLAHFAQEVAHAINNPLQVITLLLGKDKVTKRELAQGIPPVLQRIEEVVALLKQFGAAGDVRPAACDVGPLVEQAAAEAGAPLDAEAGLPRVRLDARTFATALGSLLGALRARGGPSARLRLRREGEGVALRATLPASVFEGTDPAALLDAIFTVGAEREILPALALPRALLQAQGASLDVERREDDVAFVARFALA